MHRLTTLSVTTAALLVGGAFTATTSFAQAAKDVVGTWTLESAVTEQGGTKSDTFGPGAKGVMTLDAGGHYVLTIIGAGLPKIASNNRTTATADEDKAIVGKSIAHFGTYSVNEADKTISFKIERATFPNWDASEQKRNLLFSGNELKYTVAAASAGGSATVTWSRAK